MISQIHRIVPVAKIIEITTMTQFKCGLWQTWRSLDQCDLWQTWHSLDQCGLWQTWHSLDQCDLWQTWHSLDQCDLWSNNCKESPEEKLLHNCEDFFYFCSLCTVPVQIELAPDLLPTRLHSSVGRASHRHRGGHGFKFHWISQIFFFWAFFATALVSSQLRRSLSLLFFIHSSYIWFMSYAHHHRTMASLPYDETEWLAEKNGYRPFIHFLFKLLLVCTGNCKHSFTVVFIVLPWIIT